VSKSKIEYVDMSWNPVTGCTPISPGCANCFARRRALMLAKNPKVAHPERYEDFKVSLHPERLVQPRHWKVPRRVFVCSMGDLFHDDVPDDFICQVWDMMRSCQTSRRLNHTFLVLTKRPERMADFVRRVRFDAHRRGRVFLADDPEDNSKYCLGANHKGCTGLTNIWLGATTENQSTFDERWRYLRNTPATFIFISYEPALGPLVLPPDFLERKNTWVICGGETGPGARPMHPDWVRGLRDQCVEAQVPFFFKGFGAWDYEGGGSFVRFKNHKPSRHLDGQLWEQYPERNGCDL